MIIFKRIQSLENFASKYVWSSWQLGSHNVFSLVFSYTLHWQQSTGSFASRSYISPKGSLLVIKGLGISQVPAALASFSCLAGHFKTSRVSLGKGMRVGHFWTKKLQSSFFSTPKVTVVLWSISGTQSVSSHCPARGLCDAVWLTPPWTWNRRGHTVMEGQADNDWGRNLHTLNSKEVSMSRFS